MISLNKYDNQQQFLQFSHMEKIEFPENQSSNNYKKNIKPLPMISLNKDDNQQRFLQFSHMEKIEFP